MKFLNNRGYMLVEIVVSFALVISVAYFLGRTTMSLNNKEEDLNYSVIFNADRDLMTKEVMDDVNMYDVVGITNGSNYADITYRDNGTTFVKRLKVDGNNFIYCRWSSNICDTSQYAFEKKFNSNLKLGTLSISVKSITGYRILTVKLPAKTNYSDKDYGLNIVIPYNV